MSALEAVAAETGKNVAQVALNGVLQRPSVVSTVVGARNEDQLRQNLGAGFVRTGTRAVTDLSSSGLDWSLTPQQMAKLDAASHTRPIYPYWHQRGFEAINPPPVPVIKER